MRRGLALLLLAVIGSPLITPLLLADARSELPACCWRDGKHHCAMAEPVAMGGMAVNASPESPSLKSFQPKCPFFPKPGALPAHSKFAVAGVGTKVNPAEIVGLPVVYSTSTLPLISSRGAERKRGPPPVFS